MLMLKFINLDPLDVEYSIKHQANGLKTLVFEIPRTHPLYSSLKTELQFSDGKNNYLIKFIDELEELATVSCELNLNDLKKTVFVGVTNFGSKQLSVLLPLLTDWTIHNALTINISRTLEVKDETPYSAIMKTEELYGITYDFNTIAKIITVFDEPVDRDVVITKEINIRNQSYKEDTYEHYTRLYGYGAIDEETGNEVSFASINSGLTYIDNNTYDSNIIAAVFRDDRFTDSSSLLAHCASLLDEYCRPVRVYELDVIDLSKVNVNYAEIRLHDILTFLDADKGIKEKHRVIEYLEYPDDFSKNTITLINTTNNISNYIISVDEKITTETKKIISSQTDVINQFLKRGHAVYDVDATYYCDRLPKEDAAQVMCMSMAGIGFSSTGIAGPFYQAWTLDGVLNADFIKVGTLDVSLIQGSIIDITANQSISDLETSVESAGQDASDALSAANTAQATADTAITNAATAQTQANTATTNAATANILLTDLASDSKLTAVEKQMVKKEWDGIVSEKLLNDTQATTFGITTEKTVYGTSYTTLSTYITPLLANLTTTSDIVGITFRANFKDYYDKLTSLLNAIATKAKTLADTAQTQANTATANAADAQASANAANASAAGLTTRVQAAEQKLTPQAITQTVEDTSALLAKKSYVDQTAGAFALAIGETIRDEYGNTISNIQGNFIFTSGGMEIKMTGAEFSTFYAANRIEFRQNGNVLQWLSGNKNYMTDLIIVGNLALPKHKFETLANGHTVLRYIGG